MQTRTRRSFLRVGVITSLAACARSVGVSLTRSESITGLRRVVTGRNRAGKAIIVQNGVPPRVVTTETLPGLALVEVWATDTIPTLPVAPVDLTTTMKSFVPGPGGTRFRRCRHLWRDHPGGRRRCDGEFEAGRLRRAERYTTRVAQSEHGTLVMAFVLVGATRDGRSG
jgi:hypothetical protein